MKRVMYGVLGVFVFAGPLKAGVTIVGSMHDFNRPGTGRVCIFCHVAHGARPTSDNVYYLWDRWYVPTGPFTMYDATYTDPMATASYHTYMCLSCHDGTVDITNLGQLYYFGNLVTRGIGAGVNNPIDITGGTGDSLITSHPADMDVAPGILPTSDFTDPSTWPVPGANDVGFPLFDFTAPNDSVVTCATCHEPHNRGYPQVAGQGFKFLRGDTTNSAICLKCHIK